MRGAKVLAGWEQVLHAIRQECVRRNLKGQSGAAATDATLSRKSVACVALGRASASTNAPILRELAVGVYDLRTQATFRPSDTAIGGVVLQSVGKRAATNSAPFMNSEFLKFAAAKTSETHSLTPCWQGG